MAHLDIQTPPEERPQPEPPPTSVVVNGRWAGYRAILGALCQQFGGGPVGLSTLAISVSEQTETIEDVYEPFLIQQGLLVRTPRGRVALTAAWEHLGLTAPAPPERPGALFDQL